MSKRRSGKTAAEKEPEEAETPKESEEIEAPKEPEEAETPQEPKTTEEEPIEEKEPQIYLDTLGVESIAGIGPKTEIALVRNGIKTIEDIMQIKPADIYIKIGIPIHKLIEYQKKAERILQFEFDEAIIIALAENGYTMEQAILDDPEALMNILKRDRVEIMDFLSKLIQITMYLNAITCRTYSIAILRKQKMPQIISKGQVGLTLDDLSVIAIDGLGPIIESKMNTIGIKTLTDLVQVNPTAVYKAIKVPLHKLMEYRKKAQKILELELDDEIINKLAAKDYTIQQVVEASPESLRKITEMDKDTLTKFLENLIQVTMFLDATASRNNSVSILHRIKKAEKPEAPPPEAPKLDEVRYLGKDQILAKIYSTELESTILQLLRERARNKSEIIQILEGKKLKYSLTEINEAINLLVQTDLVQLEWFEGNFDVHLFLISDFGLFRMPAFKIMEEAEKKFPNPEVAERYLVRVAEYFSSYKANPEDNLLIAHQLRDSDVFVTLTLLRERIYPLEKFPKGFGQDKVDMVSIIEKMEKAGIVKIFQDETKKEWVMLFTDLQVPQFYPEYMMENIRKDIGDKAIKPDLAIKHLDLLELNYDTFFEIYNKFFKFD